MYYRPNEHNELNVLIKFRFRTIIFQITTRPSLISRRTGQLEHNDLWRIEFANGTSSAYVHGQNTCFVLFFFFFLTRCNDRSKLSAISRGLMAVSRKRTYVFVYLYTHPSVHNIV